MSKQVKPPTPRPCDSCPFRRDVPSGVWSPVEYDKLREYDRPFIEQPAGVFQCHQSDRGSDVVRICAGWAGAYDGWDLLALRVAGPRGLMRDDDLVATCEYTTDVALFGSGDEAADHGMAEIEWPGEDAVEMIEKIRRVRSDLIEGDS